MVTILDDGIEKDHPDLISNYVSQKAMKGKLVQIIHPLILTDSDLCLFQDAEASYDVNDGDADPQPRYTQRNENR